MSFKPCVLITLIALLCTLAARAEIPVGSLSGQVRDAETLDPVIGAAVMLRNTTLGAAADLEGRFEIQNIPVGAYVVQVSAIGYEPFAQTDVVIRSGRATTVTIELNVLAVNTDEVTIRPTFFKQTTDEPVGTVELSYEEIRRAPGAVGDVSRIIMQLPSVAKVNDTRNSLVVRGGSPAENGYVIDGVEVPNINHFPLQGAASGALGMVNVNLIEDVTFQAGGFGARYGDKLSSYMDLSLRDGNRERFQVQANASFLSAGGVLEGPLANHNGSWLVSANRSYFDFIIDAFDVEASAIPWYSDVLAKVSLDASSKSKLTFIDLLGVDHSHIARKSALDNEENVFGTADWRGNTFGASWRYLWNNRGYSVTSLAHTYSSWTSDWSEAVTENRLSRNESDENTFRVHNENFLRLGRHNLSFGADAEALPYAYDRTFFETTDSYGNTTPELNIDDNNTAAKAGAFATIHLNVTDKFIASPGLRADYSDYTSNSTLSPRLQLNYQASRATSFTASTGLYSQTLPLVLLSQNSAFKNLADPQAVHYVVGLSQLLSEDTRLTVEGYVKEYEYLPLDPAQPELSVIDQTNDQDGYTAHESLRDVGKARSSGVEVMLQKKLVENLYGSISGSYFRSRYRDYTGIWRDRIYDNRYLFTVTGGYKPSPKWELSMRWVFAGGAPYTQFDLAQSTAENRGIFDNSRINEERLPDYHTLDVRVDRRFNLANSNWIIYLSIQNLYGRDNIASYYWNQVQNKPDTYKQWGTLPIIGAEFEF